MNIFYILFLVILLPFTFSAQSKKKQIVTLTNRIDSLNQVINQKEDNIETKNKTQDTCLFVIFSFSGNCFNNLILFLSC